MGAKKTSLTIRIYSAMIVVLFLFRQDLAFFRPLLDALTILLPLATLLFCFASA